MVLIKLLGSKPDLKERSVPTTLNIRDASYD